MKNFTLLFLFSLISIISVYSQDYHVGKLDSHEYRSVIKPISSNGHQTTSIRLIKEPSFNSIVGLSPYATFDGKLQSRERFDSIVDIIKFDNHSKESSVYNFSVHNKSKIINYITLDSHIVIISEHVHKKQQSLFIDVINYQTLTHTVHSKEILRFTNQKYGVVFFRKKSINTYELMLQKKFKNERTSLFHFIIDHSLKVIKQDKIYLDPNYYNSKILIQKANDDHTFVLLSNDLKGQQLLKISSDTSYSKPIALNPEHYFYGTFNDESSDDLALLSVKTLYNHIAYLSFLNIESLEYSNTPIPEEYINCLKLNQTNNGVRKYTIGSLNGRIYYIIPCNLITKQYSNGSIHTTTKYAPALIFKVDENNDIEWYNILGNKFERNERHMRINSHFNFYQTNHDIVFIYTNKKKKIVLNKIDKNTAEITEITPEELNVFHKNYINIEGSVLYENSAFFYIKASLPYMSSSRSLAEKPVWIKH